MNFIYADIVIQRSLLDRWQMDGEREGERENGWIECMGLIIKHIGIVINTD